MFRTSFCVIWYLAWSLYCFVLPTPVSFLYAAETEKIPFSSVPQRAVTMNQAATEIMLALGLESKMIGTAYMDDEVLPAFKRSYEKIPVLSEKYPSREILFDRNPDFVYASYTSAFSSKRGLANRQELQHMNITTYLSPSENHKDEKWSIVLLYQELREISLLFHVEKRAETLIAKIQQQMQQAAGNKTEKKKPTILWLDSISDTATFVGGGNGVPQEIINLAGGINIFADIAKGWGGISREQLLDRPVDIIVLIDAGWHPAAKKRKILAGDPLFASLDAVQHKRFVEIPFSASTPGIRVPEAVTILHKAVETWQRARDGK